MDIQININQIRSTIQALSNTLSSNQAQTAAAYQSLQGSFAESSGEEAEALRRLQAAEQALTDEMCQTLDQFGQSVLFAAESFGDLDNKGAKAMYQ